MFLRILFRWKWPYTFIFQSPGYWYSSTCFNHPSYYLLVIHCTIFHEYEFFNWFLVVKYSSTVLATNMIKCLWKQNKINKTHCLTFILINMMIYKQIFQVHKLPIIIGKCLMRSSPDASTKYCYIFQFFPPKWTKYEIFK